MSSCPYLIVTPDLFDDVGQFQVSNKFPESDHLPISFSLKNTLIMTKDTDSEVSGWEPTKRYKWSPSQLDYLKTIMEDKLSMAYLSEVRKSLAGLQETNDVAQAVSALIIQAADRAFPFSRGRTQFQIISPLWYDAECRHLRGLAIRAGERLTHAIDDNFEIIDECRQYRACKQRK